MPPDWGRYEILDVLGVGGMGTVYKARDRRLRRTVALKVLRSSEPQQIQRLLREARAQARVEHDLICKVYDVGEVHGYPFIAMQLINGSPLSVEKKQMPLQDKIRVLLAVAEAIHSAHRQGIIHRDLKPSGVARCISHR